jgi:hypothetical protein
MTGLNPFDLEPPTRLLLPNPNPTCPVCGKPTPALLVRSLWRGGPDRHVSCRRTMGRWRDAVQAIDADPEYRAAEATATLACVAASDLWEAKLRAIPDLPGWYVDQQLAERDQGCDQ